MGDRRRGVQDADIRLGAAIRSRRKELGRTLVQVAADTGLSHPFLSQVERGRARPSMRSLFLIAESLRTTQQALLAEATPPAGGVRLERGAGQVVDSARLLDHFEQGADVTEMVVSTEEFEEYFSHARREFVYVVSGSLEVELLAEPEKPAVHALGPRDSIAYPGHTEHRHRRTGPDPALVLIVHSGPA
ncbi:XRE family transcriptional regulator [Saccharopolyspora shandongensis]|uniref:helix-turn-helix domain-containing protein n=1 Tax=Saccharopolyspora shandongensis TaxID=418495 RepID=UPI00342D4A52